MIGRTCAPAASADGARPAAPDVVLLEEDEEAGGAGGALAFAFWCPSCGCREDGPSSETAPGTGSGCPGRFFGGAVVGRARSSELSRSPRGCGMLCDVAPGRRLGAAPAGALGGTSARTWGSRSFPSSASIISTREARLFKMPAFRHSRTRAESDKAAYFWRKAILRCRKSSEVDSCLAGLGPDVPAQFLPWFETRSSTRGSRARGCCPWYLRRLDGEGGFFPTFANLRPSTTGKCRLDCSFAVPGVGSSSAKTSRSSFWPLSTSFEYSFGMGEISLGLNSKCLREGEYSSSSSPSRPRRSLCVRSCVPRSVASDPGAEEPGWALASDTVMGVCSAASGVAPHSGPF
mmetsp:Transcript_1477/g.3457  ORF Transcript_1477/g.3457 Transcript_1477/m.3457 type:complete len:347 (-) Transcript_1477:1747-2787(-)